MFNKLGKASKITPYITAFLLFVLLSAGYFAPQFSGKEISMHDVTQYEGMSKEIVDHIRQYGEDPQWSGAMFGGMPSQLIYMKHDSVFLKQLWKIGDFMGRPASYIFVAMLAFYIMLLMFGVNPWIGIIPSLAYGLSTYFFLIIGAGHITKMIALAYAPLMVGSMAYTFRKNIWLGGALTALFASLQIAASHPQITYYFLFIMAAFWINEGLKAWKQHTLPRFAKITGVLAVSAILAVGSNYAPLHYINDYGKVSMRGGSELSEGGEGNSGLELDYATAWSYGKAESFNMFIPDLMGGASDTGFSDDGPVAQTLAKYQARNMARYIPPYWGPQPMTGGPTYIGAVIIFIFALGMFLLKGRDKWWVAAVSILAIMLAWGRNFLPLTELFFNYFPGYNKFRTVAMILVIVQWTVPFLAALVLQKIWTGEYPKAELKKGIRNALYVTGGVALFFLVLGGSLFDFSSQSDMTLLQMGYPQDVLDAMHKERASMLRMDSLRSLVFVLLTAGIMLMYVAGKIKAWALATILAVLVCVDMIPVNMRFLPQSKFQDASAITIKPTQANLQILADTTTGFRVYNIATSPFQDATTSYFHRSVGGYHGAKLQRYQEIIDRYLAKGNIEVINMLNTRYVITADEQGRPAAQFNAGANGPAWFVKEVALVENADQELAALGTLPSLDVAVVDKRFEDLLGKYATWMLPAKDSTSNIVLLEYKPNYLKYRYSNTGPGVAVFSEIFYESGWQAYVDGQEAPHFRADYILRGMVLPAGTHEVEFRYRAENYSTISTITFIFSLLIVIFIVAAVAVQIVNRNKNNIQDAGEQETQA